MLGEKKTTHCVKSTPRGLGYRICGGVGKQTRDSCLGHVLFSVGWFLGTRLLLSGSRRNGRAGLGSPGSQTVSPTVYQEV